MKAGVLLAIAAYGTWGFFPVYWKLLQHVDPLEVTAHRMTWSVFFFFALLRLAGGLKNRVPAAGRLKYS